MITFQKYAAIVFFSILPFFTFCQDLTFDSLKDLKSNDIEFAETFLSKRGWKILNVKNKDKDKTLMNYITFDHSDEFKGNSWIRIYYENDKISSFRWHFDSQIQYNRLIEEIGQKQISKKSFGTTWGGIVKKYLINGIGYSVEIKDEKEALISEGKYEVGVYSGEWFGDNYH